MGKFRLAYSRAHVINADGPVEATCHVNLKLQTRRRNCYLMLKVLRRHKVGQVLHVLQSHSCYNAPDW